MSPRLSRRPQPCEHNEGWGLNPSGCSSPDILRRPPYRAARMALAAAPQRHHRYFRRFDEGRSSSQSAYRAFATGRQMPHRQVPENPACDLEPAGRERSRSHRRIGRLCRASKFPCGFRGQPGPAGEPFHGIVPTPPADGEGLHGDTTSVWLTWRLWSWRWAFVVGDRSDMLRSTERTKKFREEYVRRRARELANTGRFERWQGIEFELRFVEGGREAGVWFGALNWDGAQGLTCRSCLLRASRLRQSHCLLPCLRRTYRRIRSPLARSWGL
jgi:hypothetical protein